MAGQVRFSLLHGFRREVSGLKVTRHADVYFRPECMSNAVSVAALVFVTFKTNKTKMCKL